MMTFEKIKLKGGGSVASVVAYLSDTAKYYEEVGSELPAYWQGKGINETGLNQPGREANNDLAALLSGRDPNTGEVVNERRPNSVLAWDLTMSPAKGFTLAIASCHDKGMRKELVQAVKEANDFAIGYVMDELRCRTGKAGTGEKIAPEKSYVRSVMHLDSRDGDPQAHIHNVLINTAIDENGKARCLEDRFDKLKGAAEGLFDARLAENFRRLGFGVNRTIERNEHGEDTGEITYTITGISRDVEMEFSSRRKAIVAAMEKAKDEGKQINGSQANKKTRKAKDSDLTPFQIIGNTCQRVIEMNAQGKIDWQDSTQLLNRHGHIETQSLDEILKVLHQTESTFTRDQFLEHVAKRSAIGTDPIKEADDFLASSKDVIRLSNGSYCSDEQRKIERGCVLSAIKRSSEYNHHLAKDVVERAIEAQQKELGHPLDHEQAEAVRHVCLRSGGFAVIEGSAGTGKTATAGAYVKAHQEAGYTVLGASTSQVATENLANEVNAKTASMDKQMKAFNTAKLLLELDSGRLELTSKHLLVLDEAGMIGARTLHRIQEHFDKAGAKIIAVGDSKQLQPIEAGKPFYQIGNEIGKAEITNIRRQKSQDHLAMAKAIYDTANKGQSLVASMKDNGMIVEASNKQSAINSLVHGYCEDKNPPKDKLIVVATHNDGDAVTKRLRSELEKSGLLGEKQSVVTARNENKRLKTEETEIAVNDRIRFTRNQKNLGVRNNDIATVVAFGEGKDGRFMTVRMDDEPTSLKQIPIKEKNHFVHGYTRTTHSAQGLGVKNVYALATKSDTLDRNMFMVNFTRTKEAFRYYGTKDEFEAVSKRIDDWKSKESVHELLPEVMRSVDRSMFEAEKAKNRLKVEIVFDRYQKEVNEQAKKHGQAALSAHEEILRLADQLEKAQVEMEKITEKRDRYNDKLARNQEKIEELGIFKLKEKSEIKEENQEIAKKIAGCENLLYEKSKAIKEIEREMTANDQIAKAEFAKYAEQKDLASEETKSKYIEMRYEKGHDPDKDRRKVIPWAKVLDERLKKDSERKRMDKELKEQIKEAVKVSPRLVRDEAAALEQSMRQRQTHVNKRDRGLSQGM